MPGKQGSFELWGAIVTAVLAILGWLQSAAMSAARLKRAQEDIQALQIKVSQYVPKDDLKQALADVSNDIREIKSALKEMDVRRDIARGEIADFRERISGDIGELRAFLKEGVHKSDM